MQTMFISFQILVLITIFHVYTERFWMPSEIIKFIFINNVSSNMVSVTEIRLPDARLTGV